MSAGRSVHLIDDEEPVRAAVGFALRNNGFDCLAYPSGDDFLRAAPTAAPGCVLLDIRMPRMDGLEVQRALNGRGVTMPVVMMTGHGDVAVAVEAMKAGAVDFIEKPFKNAVLLGAIGLALERPTADDRDAAAQAARSAIAKLTARERDVLAALARGRSNKLIAHELDISTRTVEVHRANLMRRMGIRHVSGLLRIAFAARLEPG